MRPIWVFKGPDYVAFSDEKYIEPSIAITYSAMSVLITKSFDGISCKKYAVRKPTKIGESVGELICELEFRLYHIYSEPTHM